MRKNYDVRDVKKVEIKSVCGLLKHTFYCEKRLQERETDEVRKTGMSEAEEEDVIVLGNSL